VARTTDTAAGIKVVEDHEFDGLKEGRVPLPIMRPSACSECTGGRSVRKGTEAWVLQDSGDRSRGV